MGSDASYETLDGSPSSPAFAFLSTPNTGIYRDGSGALCVVVAGRIVARFTPDGVLSGVGPVAALSAAGAVTVNAPSVVLTTESLNTAAGSVYTLTMQNSAIKANSNVCVEVGYGSATAGVPILQSVVVTGGQVVIKVLNLSATSPAGAAFNGSLVFNILVV